ncbi:MAG: hypothetical protein NTX79_07115 [Candidatus Micrarchaeota archaeon]|nr:hypothetical protein [Candidatus Micrarchaeota archaeon]
MVSQNANRNSARILSVLVFLTMFAGMASATAAVTGVTSPDANGSYKASTVINVTVTFSENVIVLGAGTTYLTLNVTPNHNASYSSGSGTSALTFQYTVQAADTAARLDYLNNASLYGDIRQSNSPGAEADKALPNPGQTGSLGANSNITIDTTAPATGTITYTSGYYTSASVAITYTNGSDTGSGLNLSSGKIQRESATLSAGTCGSYSAFSDLAASSNGSYVDTSVVSGNCYIYQYVISDNAGNPTVTVNLSKVAKVDTSAPTIGPVAISPSYNSTSFYISGNSTITAAVADAESGITGCEYNIGAGWVAGAIVGSNCTNISVNTTAATSINMRATSGAGTLVTGVAITVTPDVTAPTYVFDLPINGTYYKNGSTVNVSANITETGSGIANGTYCVPSFSVANFNGTVLYDNVTGKCTGALTISCSTTT